MGPPAKALVEQFNYCPSCGMKATPSSDSDRFGCLHCGTEIFLSPVSSAAALITDQSSKLLVIKRKKDPRKGFWGLPGGFVNKGETLEEALIREVKEEVNLDLVSWNYLGGWPNLYPFQGVIYSVVDVYFTATVESLESIALCQDELDDILFVNPKQVPSENWAFPSLLQAIEKYSLS